MGRPSTRALIFRILLITYILGVAFLCFANLGGLSSQFSRDILGIPTDKIVHFCMFFPFPILGFFAYDRLTRTPWQTLAAAVTLLSFGCIFAGLTEVIQGMMPYRSEDIRDFYADVIAIGLSTLIVFVIDAAKALKTPKGSRRR